MSKNNQKKKSDMASKIEQPNRQSAQRVFIQQFDEATEEAESKVDEKKNTKTTPKKRTATPKPTETVLSDNEIEEGDDDFWKDLKKGKSNKRRNKVLTTFYLDADLDDVIDILYEQEGKGFKSRFINESIRYSLKSKGII